MKQAVETGDEEVIVGKNEKRIDQDFIKKVNRELGAGFKGNLRLSDQTCRYCRRVYPVSRQGADQCQYRCLIDRFASRWRWNWRRNFLLTDELTQIDRNRN